MDPATRDETGSPGDGSAGSTGQGQPVVVVTVVRTGGFAGLRREWRAEPEERESFRWVTLIQECPWDAVAVTTGATGADLFVWRLDARCGDEKREAELADPDVQGPWRTLIDAVRDAGAPDPAMGA